LKEKNVPLVYLIPEDPLVYHKYGFVTVREKQEELVKLEKRSIIIALFLLRR
jgi:predicted acetyltransferase